MLHLRGFVALGSAGVLRPARGWRWPPLLLAAAMLMLVAACASTRPSTFYTLTAIPEAAGRAGDIAGGRISVGLGPVMFPQFLDRPQIVTRDGTNQLEVNEFHRWGGAIQDDFLRVWGENLAILLSSSRVTLFPSESRAPLDYRVPAEVLGFEGRAEGAAVLKVRWSVMDDRERRNVIAREDAYRCPIRGVSPGGADLTAAANARYTAVVAAMSQCLGDFSRDVAAVLVRLQEPQPPEQPAQATTTPAPASPPR